MGLHDPDPKTAALRAANALNPAADAVKDELFSSSEFFDRRDLVQARYEMLRRVRVDGWSVSRAAMTYGVTRPTFYAAHEAFSTDGLPGLLPQKRGPKHARKLTEEVLTFIRSLRADEPSIDLAQLVVRIEERFGLTIHQRSVERALARGEKKR
jgi:transposase